MDINKLSLDQCYQILELNEETATLTNIDKNYYKLVGEKLTSGKKLEIITLKQAYLQLTEYYQTKQNIQNQAQQQTYQDYLTNYLNNNLNKLPFRVEIEYLPSHIEIKIKPVKINQKSSLVKLISDLLISGSNVPIKQTKIKGYDHNNQFIWQTEINFQIEAQKLKLNFNNPNNTELLLAEAEIKTNIFAFPIAFLIGLTVSIIEPLSWFISMWIHELGHASIAWFSGYQAMVTFAGTVTSLRRSLFVYLGILFLLGLTYYSSWKEKKKTIMILTIILAIIQFILTWIISRSTYQMLLIFGGIGGEFYLSTLLIIAFYWQLPEKLYWHFWRFIALIFGAITFVSSFLKWHRIKLGKEQITWGTFWGGRGDSGGDLNILNQDFSWTINQIINTYIHLSNLCLLIIIGVYIYFCLKSNPSLLWKIKKLVSKLTKP